MSSHTGPLKSIAKRYRDRFLSGVTNSIKEQATKLDSLAKAQAITEQKLSAIQEQQTRFNNLQIIAVSESETIAKLLNGLKIYLDPRDISVAPHLALDGIWEPHITAAWMSVLEEGDTVIDIGANFGYYGLIAAHQYSRAKSKIIFLEANPDFIPYIKKSLEANFHLDRFQVENLAVAETEGTVILNILKGYTGSSSIYPIAHIDRYMHGKMRLELDKKVRVQSTSIDSYCLSHDIGEVNLIKMDIEGYEDRAYQGMRQTVLRNSKISLFVEFTAQSYDKPQDFYRQMLKDFGNVYLLTEEGHILKPRNTAYEKVVDKPEDWIMLVFSKNAKLASRSV